MVGEMLGYYQTMYLNRLAEAELTDALRSGKVTVILGARQVGKTTLVGHTLRGADVCYLNFDVEVDRARFNAAAKLPPEDAMRIFGNPELVVLDEAQRLPEAARVVKGWYDSRVAQRFVLLGSSSLDLMNRSAEPLTGRSRKVYLPPLLFEETLHAQAWASGLGADDLSRHFRDQVRTLLRERIAFGSYPEVVLSSQPQRLLRELASDYLLRDVFAMGLVRATEAIRRLVTLLAYQIGNEVSISELATQLQISRQSVERYVEMLEEGFVIFRLSAYATNLRNEVVRNRKVYFWDTGIRNALINSFSTEETRPDIGVLWENWAIAEVAKMNALRGRPCDLLFWRTRAQSEVDLVLRGPTGLRAFEAKWNPRRKPGTAFANRYGVPVETMSPDDPFVARLVP